MFATLVRRTALCLGTLASLCTFTAAQTANCSFQYFQLSSNITQISPNGINKYDTVVGQAISKTGQAINGFIRYNDGTYKIFALNGNLPTVFMKRNSSGMTVGSFSTAAHRTHGLTYLNGKTAEVDYPSAYSTLLTGINTGGTMVGYYQMASGGNYTGFKLASGHFTRIAYPGAAQTNPMAINDNGVIVGYYNNQKTGDYLNHGFVLENGVYRTLDNPQGNPGGGTALGDINNSGEIVGQYEAASNNGYDRAFLYKNNTFYQVNLPNAIYSYATGLNPQQQIAGSVVTSSGTKPYIATCQ